MRQVVILAGGKGTRLRERLNGLPKPLIDINGKPLLERQIELVKRHAFSHVLLLVNHAAEHIIEYCASRNNWGMTVECIDDGNPLGTAGATLAVFDRLDEEFLVMYGDTMLDVDLSRFCAFHHANKAAAATLFLHPNDHPYDSDLVEMDEHGRILNFYPYPHDADRFYPNLVNAALYCIRRPALLPWRRSGKGMDFGKDLFPHLLASGAVLQGYNSPEYIKDCGTPERLDKVCADMTSGRVSSSSLGTKQSAIFLDRDGTINREVSHISHHEQFEMLPGVEEAIKQINRSAYRTVVITNQPVLARGDCSAEGLLQIHNKMDTLLGKQGAYIDRLYYCPHHPDQGFPGEIAELKIDCNCRKPSPGMVEQAVEELNIDVSSSWLVGDTSVDMLTAVRAGLRSILVETGFAGLDRRHWVVPDYVVPDLPAAVRFILKEHPRLLQMCKPMAERIDAGDFVFVGGLSRSGKSNFSSVLKEALAIRGKHAVVLALDGFLLDEQDRASGVMGRYDVAGIRAALSLLANRRQAVELALSSYDKLERRRVPQSNRLGIAPEDVVIVEGTIALSLLDCAHGHKLHTCFVGLDEQERRRRVLHEYRLRGSNTAEAEGIYASRQKDEMPCIMANSGLAEWRFSLEFTSDRGLA